MLYTYTYTQVMVSGPNDRIVDHHAISMKGAHPLAKLFISVMLYHLCPLTHHILSLATTIYAVAVDLSSLHT